MRKFNKFMLFSFDDLKKLITFGLDFKTEIT